MREKSDGKGIVRQTSKDIMCVAIIGHNDIKEPLWVIRQALNTVMFALMVRSEKVNFHFGREGGFDKYSAVIITSMINRLRLFNFHRIYDLPYMPPYFEDKAVYYYLFYDYIDDNNTREATVLKDADERERAVLRRDREIIDKSSLCIFYSPFDKCAACTTYASMCYARRIGKRVINLAEINEVEALRSIFFKWYDDPCE